MATPAAQPSQSSEGWQTTKETFRDRTAFMFNNELMSDIKFVVGESDSRQVRIPAHKFVLAISSPVFQAMFYGQMAEKGEEVELPDTDSHTLLEFLRFVYCDEVNLTADNVFAVLYLADKYIVPSLAAKCWSFIDANTTACVKSDRAVSTLSHVTLVTLVKRESLRTKELPLFEAVKNWAEAKCEEKRLEATGEALREILGNAVDFIRFPTMSQKEFAHHVVPTGILSSDKALEVYQFWSGVTPATEMKFSCTKRQGILSKSALLRCRRYPSNMATVTSLQAFNELTGSLTFQTDRDIYFRGVCLYAGATEEQKIRTVVRVLTEETGMELTAEEGIFTMDSISAGSDFDILFTIPVQVRALSKYMIHATVKVINGAKVHFSTPYFLLSAVSCAGVNFTFEGESELISGLLFHQ